MSGQIAEIPKWGFHLRNWAKARSYSSQCFPNQNRCFSANWYPHKHQGDCKCYLYLQLLYWDQREEWPIQMNWAGFSRLISVESWILATSQRDRLETRLVSFIRWQSCCLSQQHTGSKSLLVGKEQVHSILRTNLYSSDLIPMSS